MKTLSRHEKVTLILVLVAIMFLAISYFWGVDKSLTGILQGFATGLLSGIVLLLITGIKSKEYKYLNQQYHVIHEINLALTEIEQSYGTFYHKTYHGKKKQMGINDYSILVNDFYKKCKEIYLKLQKCDYEIIQNSDVKAEAENYMNFMDEKLHELERKMCNSEVENKEILVRIENIFYEIQYKSYIVLIKNKKLENEIYKEREHVGNSWV